MALEEVQLNETQAVTDRNFALGLRDCAIPPLGTPQDERESTLRDSTSEAAEASLLFDDSVSTIAGPSGHCASKVEIALGYQPDGHVECKVCKESVRCHDTVHLVCGDTYCRPCL